MPRVEERDGTAPWSLVTYVDGSLGTRVGALVDRGSVVPIPWLPDVTDVGVIVERWAELRDLLIAWEPDHNQAVTGVKLQVPIRAPGKLLFAGANFDDHIREMGIAAVPAGLRPYFFLLPRTALAAPGEAIQVPEEPSARIDWEAELAVVIGLAGRHIGVDTALEHVAGYTIINDVTARGLHHRTVELAPPFAYDWLGSKGRDSFCPMGPGIVLARFVPDPQDLSIRLWVNDELRQDGHTSDMIFAVAELISSASEVMTLEPGDVISTGTPAGVGAQRGQHLKPGDVVVAEIPPLGRLENRVITERTPRPLVSAATSNPT
jgi:2-keto-4-pentenoate hydratase/2-oxohepta-3-ene-1,7-dioic acid hydratase in catechol pathway